MAEASCVNLYTEWLSVWFVFGKLNIHHSTIQRWWWRRRISSGSYNYAQQTWFHPIAWTLRLVMCLYLDCNLAWRTTPLSFVDDMDGKLAWTSFTSRTMSQLLALIRTCGTHEIKASSLIRSSRPTSFALDSIRSRLHWWASWFNGRTCCSLSQEVADINDFDNYFTTFNFRIIFNASPNTILFLSHFVECLFLYKANRVISYWNSLPSQVVNVDSVGCFKRAVKKN